MEYHWKKNLFGASLFILNERNEFWINLLPYFAFGREKMSREHFDWQVGFGWLCFCVNIHYSNYK